MKDPEKKKTFFASCPKGLEELLESEILTFGEISRRVTSGRYFRASPARGLEFLFHSRIASRVFLQIETFTFQNEKDLYEKAKQKWWHKVFRQTQSFKVESHTDLKSSKVFKNSLYLSRLLKDAIVDSFRENTGERPNVELKNPAIQIGLRVEKHKERGFTALLSLDLVGNTPLSHRGYRRSGHAAPLRENLAAGLVMMTDWESRNEVFLDPMCGSGTLLIEALMAKKGIAPSFLRLQNALKERQPPFAFFQHLWFEELGLSPILYDKLMRTLEKSKRQLKTPSITKVYGGDLSSDCIDQTRASLEEYDFLAEDYELVCQSVFDWEKLPGEGIILTNPPYGQRLDLGMEKEEFLHQLKSHLKQNFSGYRVFLISPKEEGINLPLKADKKQKVFNGSLECQFFKYRVN